MPVYTYQCPKGHVMDGYWPVAKRPKRTRCVCGKPATQVILDAPAIHTCATFSRDIHDPDVIESRCPGDGSYVDPTLSFHPETGEFVTKIKSERHRSRLMQERGLVEAPMSDKAKDVALDRKRGRKTYTGVGPRA